MRRLHGRSGSRRGLVCSIRTFVLMSLWVGVLVVAGAGRVYGVAVDRVQGWVGREVR